MAMRELIGKLAYAAIFVLLWPALLVAWSIKLDAANFVTWPTPLRLPLAAAALAFGAILMTVAMRALWIHGGGRDDASSSRPTACSCIRSMSATPPWCSGPQRLPARPRASGS